MRRFHIALSIENIEESIVDYSRILGCAPCVVVPNEYALWRNDVVNFSIKRVENAQERLRHLGWEDSDANSFTMENDKNGITWEKFSASQQAEEINRIWPDTDYHAYEN